MNMSWHSRYKEVQRPMDCDQLTKRTKPKALQKASNFLGGKAFVKILASLSYVGTYAKLIFYGVSPQHNDSEPQCS